MVSKRENIISELVTTERTFLTNLNLAQTTFITPLLQTIQTSQSPFLPLFSKLHDVATQATDFLSILEQFISAPFALSKAFAPFRSLVLIYFDYANSYHHLWRSFMNERRSNQTLDSFCTEREIAINYSIQNILIQPIQRPPRYRLLIQELLKVTPADDPDHSFLEETLTHLCSAIAKIDQQIEEFDEMMRQIELQSRLADFEVMAPGRRLYFDGPAAKYSRSYTNARHIALFSDLLLVAEEASFKI
jgi:hypothetical protein